MSATRGGTADPQTNESTSNANVTPVDLDPKAIAVKFREYMDASSGGIREIGATTEGKSLDSIAQQISEVKAAERARKESLKPKKYVPPGGWKEPDAEWLASLPPGKPDPVLNAKKMVTIAKYREMQKPRTWDSCMIPSAPLLKVLWRRTQCDGSGHRIFNLSRDAYPKDIPAQWKPGTFDQDLPNPSLELTTHSFRGMLTRHVESAPIKVEKEVKGLSSRTTAESNYKSRMAGELASLRRMRDTVKAELADVAKKEAEATKKLCHADKSRGKKLI